MRLRDLKHFSVDDHDYVFRAGRETQTGRSSDGHFLNLNAKVAFGRPNGLRLDDGAVLAWYWCTTDSITHTRWARLAIDP